MKKSRPRPRRRVTARPRRTATDRLRERLREAEDTLAAIREGHVEALIIQAPHGEELFTLRSADQPYRLMVEQMREGALTVAPDGTVLYCNNRFAEMIGVPAPRVSGQPITKFMATADVVKVPAMLGAESYREDFEFRTADGGVIPAQVSSTALRIDGVRTVAVVVTDLSHERAEHGLRESNRLKDEFLATLSHELRTPLNVILGWTRMMLQGQMSEATRLHALGLVERNAQAQAQLVNDLVDMSRIISGKLPVDLQPMPVVPVIEAALDNIRPAATARRLSLQAHWDAPDAWVMADATRLQQVFWNLLTNAVKFTPPEGTVTVRAQQFGDEVRIEVADTGIGIEHSFLAHVFDRFRQADSRTTRSYGGLGLGLAIVRDLVHLHGGHVKVESEGAHRGSTFVVSLRAAAATKGAAVRPRLSAQAPRLDGRRVLLLEDHADSRDLLVQVLEGSGAVVAAFATAADALTALPRIGPAVIVADIGLPGEDGYSFIRSVRAHPTRRIRIVPAIAVTAYATTPDRQEALSVGFQHHMAKPIDPQQLVEAIHELTHKRRRSSPHSSR